jgi:hypothetical protein
MGTLMEEELITFVNIVCVDVMISTLPIGTVTLYLDNYERKHMLWNNN